MTQSESELGAAAPLPHRVGVVLLAAGRGERFGGGIPKQFALLCGEPVFTYSLRTLDAIPSVTETVLVLPKLDRRPKELPLIKDLHHPLKRVLGGERRQDSVAAGLAALALPFDLALIHDAARPFPHLYSTLILIGRSMETGGGLLAIRATDTVKRAVPNRQAGEGELVAETLDRNTIWLAQTPQAIRGDLVPRAIEELRRPDLAVTDEASLLESWGIPVALVESSAGNFKITTSGDLLRAETFVKRPA